jgi:sialic acid synthase SpsE
MAIAAACSAFNKSHTTANSTLRAAAGAGAAAVKLAEVVKDMITQAQENTSPCRSS